MADREFKVGDRVRYCPSYERSMGRTDVFVIRELHERTWGTSATIEEEDGGFRSGANTKFLVHAR